MFHKTLSDPDSYLIRAILNWNYTQQRIYYSLRSGHSDFFQKNQPDLICYFSIDYC